MGDSSPATTTQNQNTTTTSNPWATATPLLNNLIGSYTGVNPAVTPAQSNAAQGLQTAAAGIPNLTPQATNAIQQMFSQNPGMLTSTLGQTQANLSPITSASLNPWQTPGFSDAMNTLTQNITNATKGVYAGSGRDPSGAGDFGKSLAYNIAGAEAPAVASQYNANVGNLTNASQILQNAGISTEQALGGNVMQALQGAGVLPSLAMAPATAQFQAANTAYGLPIQNINALLQPAATLGGMGGTTTGTGYMTGTQTPANNPFMNILGGATAGAGILGALGSAGGSSGIAGLAPLLAMSDRRAKTNIKDIGRTHDNQKIYSFQYKGHPAPQIGMMAQEIEKKTPEAVVTAPDGLKRVNYDLATRRAQKLGMMPAYRQAA